MKWLLDINVMTPLCVALFWAIVFLQSALDKVFDFKGNLEWLTGHFEKTPLNGTVKPALITITIFEFAAGACSLAGLAIYLINRSTFLIEMGVILVMVSLCMLIFGQRVAKDYEGAKTIAIYFGIALVSVLILGNFPEPA